MLDEVPRLSDPEEVRLHNFRMECVYSLLIGVFMGMICYASLVVAQTCLDAKAIHLTVIVSAFPCGSFLGSMWARLGQHWGMKQLVVRTGVAANLLLFLIPFVEHVPGVSPATAFTAIAAVSQLLFSGMRMGQSSLYRCTYPAVSRGRVLGWFVSLSFGSMLPALILTGFLIDGKCTPQTHPWLAPLFAIGGEHACHPSNYRWLYPVSGLIGLLGFAFYRRLILLEQPSIGEPLSLWQTWGKLTQVLRSDRRFFWFQVGYFLNGTAFFLTVHVVVKLCDEDLHFTPSQLAIALTALPIAALALSSWMWGRVMDRLGIITMRVLVSVVMSAYLACYVIGLWRRIPELIFLGGLLRGLAEGGGQVTWALASVQFAPETDDVPVYNSIHFTLNGTRGLIMPAVGAALLGPLGIWTVAVALAVSVSAIFVNAGQPKVQAMGSATDLEPPSESVAGPLIRKGVADTAEIAK
jgi:MFS family permease